MLKVSCRNYYCVQIFHRMELVVVSDLRDVCAGFLINLCGRFIASEFPKIRDRHQLEIETARQLQESWNQSVICAIARTNYAYANATVRSENLRVAGSARADYNSCCAYRGLLDEIAA